MPGQIVVPTPGSVLQGPVFSDFQPHSHLLSNVTIAERAVVTTQDDHLYETGYVVRIFVPLAYGMSLYEQTTIEVTSDTTFITNINTTNQKPYVTPTFTPGIADGFTQAQVIIMTGTVDNVAGDP